MEGLSFGDPINALQSRKRDLQYQVCRQRSARPEILDQRMAVSRHPSALCLSVARNRTGARSERFKLRFQYR